MNGRELYELIQQNFHTLGGNWVVDEDDNLRITGYTQPTGLVFDQTLGKITELVVEWDTTCLGAGGYIHSNLSPVFYSDTDFNPESENHDSKFRILVHNCDYTNGGNDVGTLMSIPPETPIGEGNIWANATQPTAQGSITPDTRHTFKFEKRDGYLKFYEDDVLLSTRVDDYANIPLYFGWYFWFGSNDSDYSANFIIHSYSMSGRDTTAVTPSTGTIDIEFVGRAALARIASIIKNYVDNHTHSKSTLDTAFSGIQSTLEQLQDGLDTQSDTINQHIQDSVSRITAAERATEQLQDGLDTQSDTINQHIQDSVSHITAAERATWNSMANGGGSSSGNYVALPENDDDEFTVGSVVFCQIKAWKFPTELSSTKYRLQHGDQISGSNLMVAQFVLSTPDKSEYYVYPNGERTLSGEWIYLGADVDVYDSTTYFYGMFRRKS